MRRIALLSPLIIVAVLTGSAVAQTSKLTAEEGCCDLTNTTPADWTSPEDLLRELRSADDSTRMGALSLLGLKDEQIHVEVLAQTSPAHVTGLKLVTPDQVQLRYATLGDDGAEQAILAIELDETSHVYVAVATPVNGGWRRVAAYGCWCKYDLDRDALTKFVQVQPAPEGSSPAGWELVIHESGGGTGLYEQTESRYRMHEGGLVRVASFVSWLDSCPMAPPVPCTTDRRWFYMTAVNGSMGAVLIEGHITWSAHVVPTVSPIREIENHKFQRMMCTGFKWDSQLFRYEQVKITRDPCIANPPNVMGSAREIGSGGAINPPFQQRR